MAESQSTTSPDPDADRKAKHAAYSRAYRAANREKVAAYDKAYKADPDRKAKKAAYDRAIRAARPGENAARCKAYQEGHREEIAARKKAYSEANKGERAAYYRAYNEANKGRKYGLAADQYEAMVAACNGRCPCCKAQFSTITRTRACVDHCHSTGKVRGIVCNRCNLVLGHAGDNASILRACARYLDETKAAEREAS